MPVEYGPGVLRRVGQAITGATGERPRTLADVDEYGRGANPMIARELAGLPPTGKLPPLGSEARRRYRAELRTVQRYPKRPGAGERRHTAAGERRIMRAVERVFPVDPTAELRAVGATMVIRGEIRVSDTFSWRIMPISGETDLGGPDLAAALDAWAAGDLNTAGAELLSAFWQAYWGDHEPVREMRSLDWIAFTSGQA